MKESTSQLSHSKRILIREILNQSTDQIDSIMPGTGIESHPDYRNLRPEMIRDAFNPLPSKRIQKKMDFFYLPYQDKKNLTLDQNRNKYMDYDQDDSTVEYMFKVEALLKKSDIPFKEKQMIFDTHNRLKQEVNSEIMNSGWRKLYKFITDSVNDQRLQNHITESISKMQEPRNNSPTSSMKKKKTTLKSMASQNTINSPQFKSTSRTRLKE